MFRWAWLYGFPDAGVPPGLGGDVLDWISLSLDERLASAATRERRSKGVDGLACEDDDGGTMTPRRI